MRFLEACKVVRPKGAGPMSDFTDFSEGADTKKPHIIVYAI
jgi:hypothetical protein